MGVAKTGYKKYRSALIIQGPMVSQGVSGAFTGKIRNIKSSDLVEYDCSESIQKNIINARKYFETIILSVWEHDKILIEKKIKLKTLPDLIIYNDQSLIHNEYKKRNENSKFSGMPFTMNNMDKQWLSTLSGVEAALNYSTSACVKIRTDQTVNMKLLYKSLHASYLSDKILVPYIDADKPWALPDFYFGGNSISMFKLLNYMLNSQIKFFSENVHDQFFFGGSYFLSKTRNYDWFHYIKKTNRFSKTQKHIIVEAWEQVWTPGSKQILRSMVWRGFKFNLKNRNISFDRKEIPRILSIIKTNRETNINFNLLLKNVFRDYSSKQKIKIKILIFLLKKVLKSWIRIH